MGKKLKKKVPQKKKIAQRNNNNRRDNWLLDGRRYLDSESPHIYDGQANEASGTKFWSSSETFLCSCNIGDIGIDHE